MKYEARQYVHGLLFLLLLCSHEVISVKTTIEFNVKLSKIASLTEQFHSSILAIKKHTKSLGDVQKEHLRSQNGQFSPELTALLEVINAPDYEQRVHEAAEQLPEHHVSSFLEQWNAKQTCASVGGKCINTRSTECSVDTKVGMCPGAAHVQCCTGKAAKPDAAPADAAPDKESFDDHAPDASVTKGEEETVGTFVLTLLKATVTRDLDLVGGKSDLMIDTSVGQGEDKLQQVSMVHDNTHEVDFTKESDATFTFRNVEKDERFVLSALDDDAVGFERIGRTDKMPVGKSRSESQATFKYIKTKCDSSDAFLKKGRLGHNEICDAGAVSFKTSFTPGRTQDIGGGDPIWEKPWKVIQGYPTYDKAMGDKLGSRAEQGEARVNGFLSGIISGLSVGMSDMIRENDCWSSMLDDLKVSWQPLAAKWEKMESNLRAEAKEGLTLVAVKQLFRDFMAVAKAFAQFLVALATKSFCWTMVFTMVAFMAGLFILSALGLNPALPFFIMNMIFSAVFLKDQLLALKSNFVDCGEQCKQLKHVHGAWKAIGGIIGCVAQGFIFLKASGPLLQKVNLQLAKLGKNIRVKASMLKKAKAKGSKGMKTKVDDAPCAPCSRRRRLLQKSCCFIGASSRTDKYKYVDNKDGTFSKVAKEKTYYNDGETRDILLGYGKKNKLVKDLGNHVKYPNEALNPNLVTHKFTSNNAKWEKVVKPTIKKYQKEYREYESAVRMFGKNSVNGGKGMDDIKILDWDGSTKALRDRAKQGVSPPIEAIVPGAPGSRWKMSDDLIGIVKNYDGPLDGKGYPVKWDSSKWGDILDVVRTRL